MLFSLIKVLSKTNGKKKILGDNFKDMDSIGFIYRDMDLFGGKTDADDLDACQVTGVENSGNWPKT